MIIAQKSKKGKPFGVPFRKKIGIFKKRSACAAERKSVNPLSQVGALLAASDFPFPDLAYRHRPNRAPEKILWIKVIRTPNTADRCIGYDAPTALLQSILYPPKREFATVCKKFFGIFFVTVAVLAKYKEAGARNAERLP